MQLPYFPAASHNQAKDARKERIKGAFDKPPKPHRHYKKATKEARLLKEEEPSIVTLTKPLKRKLITKLTLERKPAALKATGKAKGRKKRQEDRSPKSPANEYAENE